MFTHSRRNLTWWFTLSMGSILLLFAGVMYYQRVADQLEAIDRLLYKKARVIAASIEYDETDTDFEPVNLDNAPLLGNTPPPPGYRNRLRPVVYPNRPADPIFLALYPPSSSMPHQSFRPCNGLPM